MTLGPFDITAERIQAPGQSFTPFGNRLLVVQVSASRVHGHQLAINSNETTPDGGVDAALRNGVGTDFMPPATRHGNSSAPASGSQACAAEFENAAWAHEFIRSGGAYIMVIGTPYPDNLIEARRRKIAEKAVELDLLAGDDPDRIRVYDANRLARWASRFPAVAVSQLSGGQGLVAVDFDSGRAALPTRHPGCLTMNATRPPNPSGRRWRRRVKLRSESKATSGIGKTRLVMEALRTPELQPLVAYVADANAVSGELLTHLVSEGRTAVLVVDECPVSGTSSLSSSCRPTRRSSSSRSETSEPPSHADRLSGSKQSTLMPPMSFSRSTSRLCRQKLADSSPITAKATLVG